MVSRTSVTRRNRTSAGPVLFGDERLLSESLPRKAELRAATNLGVLFDDCHNYLYANEGMLKDRIFHEMLKLLLMKLVDETAAREILQFGITADEYQRAMAGHSTAFEARIADLFASAKQKAGNKLSDDELRLKPPSLAYVVSKLQGVDMLNTPRDVKGEAFQAFVGRNQRGDRGEFFTPLPVVRLATALAAPNQDERVVDPACGSGGFLLDAMNRVAQDKTDVDRAEYIRRSLCGIEFNPDVALSAALRMVFEGGTGDEIRCENSLAGEVELEGQFDVVLTNPPFGTKGKIEDRRTLERYQLARRWSQTAGKWRPNEALLGGQTPEILFLERCINLLRPGGRLAIVVPDGLLQNASTAYVRAWLLNNSRLLAVISLPQETFVPYGTGIKTSVLVVQKLPSRANQVFMARVGQIGYDVKGQTIFARGRSGELLRGANLEPIVAEDITSVIASFFAMGSVDPNVGFTVPHSEIRDRFDVDFYEPADLAIVETLKRATSKKLKDLAEIVDSGSDFRLAGNSTIRYVAISDVDSRTMQIVSQQTMKAHEAPSRATYQLQAGDIITAVSGASTGTEKHATALVTDSEHDAICSNGFAVIRNVHAVDSMYLLAFFRTDLYLRQVRRRMTGHAIPCISLDELAEVLVPIPPREDQSRIAREMAELHAARRALTQRADQFAIETRQTIEAALRA